MDNKAVMNKLIYFLVLISIILSVGCTNLLVNYKQKCKNSGVDAFFGSMLKIGSITYQNENSQLIMLFNETNKELFKNYVSLDKIVIQENKKCTFSVQDKSWEFNLTSIWGEDRDEYYKFKMDLSIENHSLKIISEKDVFDEWIIQQVYYDGIKIIEDEKIDWTGLTYISIVALGSQNYKQTQEQSLIKINDKDYFYLELPYTNNMIVINSDEEVDIKIFTNASEMLRWRQGKTYYHYPNCEAKEVTTYKRECEVNEGAYLAIENPSTYG